MIRIIMIELVNYLITLGLMAMEHELKITSSIGHKNQFAKEGKCNGLVMGSLLLGHPVVYIKCW